MQTIPRTLFAFAAIAATAGSLQAQEPTQDEKNLGATVALTVTTPGGLPPMLTRSMLGGPAAGPQLAVRYGRVEFESEPGDNVGINNFAATGILSLGAAATVNATVGLYNPDCTDCNSELMLGIGGDLALGGYSFGVDVGSPRLTLALGGEIGYTNSDGGKALSGAASVPVSLVMGQSTGWRFVPFLTPALGYGSLEDTDIDQTFSATRFMLGGGVGFVNTASLVGVTVGFQKIFFNWDAADISSKTLFGVTVSIGR